MAVAASDSERENLLLQYHGALRLEHSSKGCILTFFTTLAKFTSCLIYVYRLIHIHVNILFSAMSCIYSNYVMQTSMYMYNIEYYCSYCTFLCGLKNGMAAIIILRIIQIILTLVQLQTEISIAMK